MKHLLVAACAAAMALASQAGAAVQTVYFTVDPVGLGEGWFGDGSAYGLTTSAVLTGTLDIDDSSIFDNDPGAGEEWTSDYTAIVGIGLTTGSRTWTLADILPEHPAGPPFVTSINWTTAVGDPDTITLYMDGGSFFRMGLEGVQTPQSFLVRQGDNFLGCNNCSTFSLTPPAEVPEPSTWALLIAGFGLAGSALRRQSQKVAAIV